MNERSYQRFMGLLGNCIQYAEQLTQGSHEADHEECWDGIYDDLVAIRDEAKELHREATVHERATVYEIARLHRERAR